MKRKLQLFRPEKFAKTGKTIRVSLKTIERLTKIRQALTRLIVSEPKFQTPDFPFDFTNDAVLTLVLKVFARDYSIPLTLKEKPHSEPSNEPDGGSGPTTGDDGTNGQAGPEPGSSD